MPRLLDPGERPGAWDTMGDLARRIARLEAVPGDVDVVAYAFRQVNVYTIAPGSVDFQVPDGDWSIGSSDVTPVAITFSGGDWTISEPGIYVASAGCRFQNSANVTVGGVYNFALSVLSGGNLCDAQTSVADLTAAFKFTANPGTSMMWDTGTDLAFNVVHHGFNNTSDADVDVGFVNVNLWRIAESPGPLAP